MASLTRLATALVASAGSLATSVAAQAMLHGVVVDSAGLSNESVVQLRRIGFRPLALTVVPRAADLDTTLVLAALPLRLEELTTRARSAPFRFDLIPSFAIDDSTFRLTGHYDPGGAALSDVGDALAIDFDSRNGRALASRSWRLLQGEIWSKGMGQVICKGAAGQPLAGQFVSGEADQIATLTDSGQVFLSVPIGEGRRPGCGPVFALPRDWRPQAAAGTLGRWYVVVPDSAGEPRIAAISDHGRVEWILPLGQWLPGSAAGAVRVAARGPLLTVAAVAFPFPWIVLDSAGTTLLGGSPIADADPWTSTTMPTDRWEAAALLPLETGYAQSVQTRDGRRRITVAYDPRGRVVRVDRSGSAPLLIASALHTRKLLGVRTSWNGRGRLFEFGY